MFRPAANSLLRSAARMASQVGAVLSIYSFLDEVSITFNKSSKTRQLTPNCPPLQKRCMSEMAFTFAAPNAVHYTDADVKQIDVPSFSGSFGILPNHVPALAVLK